MSCYSCWRESHGLCGIIKHQVVRDKSYFIGFVVILSRTNSNVVLGNGNFHMFKVDTGGIPFQMYYSEPLILTA